MLSNPSNSPILETALYVGYAFLGVAFLLSLFRLTKGPSAIDRVVALDLLAGIALAAAALHAIETGLDVYLNIALCIAIVSFIGTVAFAMRLERKPQEIWKS